MYIIVYNSHFTECVYQFLVNLRIGNMAGRSEAEQALHQPHAVCALRPSTEGTTAGTVHDPGIFWEWTLP